MQTTSGQHSIAFLPDRLNSEPVVFRGLTNPEMFMLAKLGALVWFPLSLLGAWLCHATVIGLGVGMALTLLTVVVGGSWMQRIKRGRPEGYHERQLLIWFQEKGIGSTVFLRYSGRWSSLRPSLLFTREKRKP